MFPSFDTEQFNNFKEELNKISTQTLKYSSLPQKIGEPIAPTLEETVNLLNNYFTEDNQKTVLQYFEFINQLNQLREEKNTLTKQQEELRQEVMHVSALYANTHTLYTALKKNLKSGSKITEDDLFLGEKPYSLIEASKDSINKLRNVFSKKSTNKNKPI